MPRLVPLPAELLDRPFAAHDGRAFGLTDKRMRGADLERPFHGVRQVGDMGTLRSRAESYRPVMDELAFFCGTTAASLWGMPVPVGADVAADLHVAVPSPHRAPRGVGIAGHKYVIAPGEVVIAETLPLTSLERTWCDLASELQMPDLVAAGDWALRAGMSMADLANLVVRHPGRRGRALRREALGLLDARSESPKESHVRVLLVRAGLGGFEPNVEVVVFGHRYRLDLAWPARKIVIEYQGGYHHDPAQWRRDMTRRSRLEAAGWTVVFISADDLRDPADLIRRIRALLAR